MSYKTMIFDIDGTLIDSAYPVLYALQHAVLETTGKHYEFTELEFALGIPSTEVIKQLTGDKWKEAMALGKKYFSSSASNILVFDGIRATLRCLLEKGIQLGIVTSKTAGEFAGFCKTYDIAKYFVHAIHAEDTPYHKPHPEPLLSCARLFDAKPETVLYIGDSIYDMECADNAGIDFALALWGCHEPDQITAKYRLEKPEDLLTIV